MSAPLSIFWFRRDLRLDDNAGLYHALKNGQPVLPIFIFDRNILDDLEQKSDSRVEFIHDVIVDLNRQLGEKGSSVGVYYGKPDSIFKQLLKEYDIAAVYANHDYEPYAIERDENIRKMLNTTSIPLHTFKDQVVFEKDEIVKDDGSPYTVFTPYSRKWREKLNDFFLRSYPSEKYLDNLFKRDSSAIPSLKSMGFNPGGQKIPSEKISAVLLKKYKENRDYPGLDGTSRIGVHLRFGTVSIRRLAQQAKKFSDTFLNELIWRDFYAMILWSFPHVGRGRAFRKEYDLIKWRNDEEEFAKWCNGQTGYPIVDAGMRQLNEIGFMHNRVRMITASFLAKHLLIDWRWGEAYFAEKLLDFDLASNNGGWQWAAGSGCDAAPYFRVFNPTLQTKKFDADLSYIKKWVPEFQEFTYPAPMVDHEFARKRCLQVYSEAVKKS